MNCFTALLLNTLLIVTIGAQPANAITPLSTISSDSTHQSTLACPILFIHGYNSSPEVWGFDVGDEKVVDGHENTNTYIYRYFTEGDRDNNGYPRSLTAYNLAKQYSLTNTDINHNRLEVFNAADRRAQGETGLNSQTDELYARMVEVLDEYYGFSWEHNQSSRIILVCHSQGGLLARNLFARYKDKTGANAIAHIERMVTLGTPLRGAQITHEPVPADSTNTQLINILQQREALAGMNITTNPQSPFIRNLQQSPALNPATGAIQPWIFVQFKKAAGFNDLCAAAPMLVELNQAGDFVIPFESQSLFDKYPPAAQNSAVFAIEVENSAWHCNEPDEHAVIIEALEVPVHADIKPEKPIK